MSKQATRKLVVCGGNGFLGSRICRYGVGKGWDVTSISRSGEPHWKSVSDSNAPPAWALKVAWERADVFHPETYEPLLRGADHVVHSMGILFEANYKGIVSGRDSPLSYFFRRPAPPQSTTASPSSSTGLTYERMNRDSALTLARAASDAGVSTFCFVSAAAGSPILPARYISTKREAEAAIAADFPTMRPLLIRPPLLFDRSRPITLALAAFAGLASHLSDGALARPLGAAAMRPLRVDTVAQAIVEALDDRLIRGEVDTAEMDRLFDRAWRRDML